MYFLADMNTEGNVSDKAIVQPSEQPRTFPRVSWWSEHNPRHPTFERLPECSVSPPMATGV